MRVRLSLFIAVALLAFAAISPAAGAQQINPTGPGDAQLAQYVEPEAGGGGQAPPAPSEREVSELAFTGLTLLPLALIGVGMVFAGLAWQRRRADSPRPA
jgi:hypothetical protein